MKRQLLIGACIAVLGIVAWFVMAGGGGERGRGAVPKAGEVASAERTGPSAPEVPVQPAAAVVESPVAAPAVAPVTRAAVSEEALARGVWVEGVVIFPPGTPVDERAFVEARGKKAEDAEFHEVEVAADGKFRVAFGEGTKSGRLHLRGRYVYLERGTSWKESEPGLVTLEPLLGARLEGRVVFPAGEKLGKEDRLQLQHTRKMGTRGESDQTIHTLAGDGSFEVGGIALHDSFKLSFAGERCFGLSEEFTLGAGETRRLELVLERGVVIAGRLSDSDGAPVKGASLNASRQGNMWREFDHQWGQVEQDGSFRLKALRPGKLELSVQAPGFTELERELGALAAGEDQELALTLERGGTIAGRLLWPDGSPAVGFVSAEEDDDFAFNENAAKTGEDGRFTLSGFEAERVTVRARATKTVEVTVKSELTGKERQKKQKQPWNAVAEDVAVGTQDLVLTLAASLELTGTVVEEGGAPVGDFRVVAHPIGDGTDFDFTGQLAKPFRDANGTFTMPGFTPGRWRVTASSKVHVESEPLEIELPTDGPVTLVLRRGALVSGVVVDASGKTVAGAAIAVEANRHRDSWSLSSIDDEPISDADGRFHLPKVEPGVVSVSASMPGFAPSEPQVLELVAGRETSGVVLTLQVGATLSGEVVELDGRPAAGVHIWAFLRTSGSNHHQNAESGANGRFELSGLPPGHYQVQATLESGPRLQAEVELVAGAREHVRLAPETRNAARLFGRVTLGGEPVEGLQVNAHARGGSGGSSNAETNAEGEYELRIVGGGLHSISLHRWEPDLNSARNYWSLTLDIPESGELRQDFTIPLARVRGRVTSEDGEPLMGVRVSASGSGEDGQLVLRHATADTKADGTYELSASPGAMRMKAGGSSGGREGSAWSEAQREVVLADGQELSGVDFVLARGGRLTGLVRYTDGTLAGQVGLMNAATGQRIGFSQDDGTFDLAGLAAGPLEIEVRDDEGVTERPIAVTIVPEATSTIELTLTPAVMVQVKLEGLPEGAEPKASVRLADGRVRDAWFREGTVVLPALGRGTHVLTVELGEQRAEKVIELLGDEQKLELSLALE